MLPFPPLMSQVAHLFPEPTPVVLRVQLGATPVVAFHTSNSTLQLQPFVEVFAASSNLALQFLFSLDVVSDWSGWGDSSLRPHMPLRSPCLL